MVNINNKMETMDMKKLAFSMSLPMIVSMIALALYNIVDGIFVSQIGYEALDAISLVAPVQSIMIAIALGTGVGINSLTSRKLGEKSIKDVKRVIGNGIGIIFISWLIVAVLGFLFVKPYMEFFSDNELVIKYGCEYLSICMIFSLGMFFQIAFEKILEALGKPNLSMSVQFIRSNNKFNFRSNAHFWLWNYTKFWCKGCCYCYGYRTIHWNV